MVQNRRVDVEEESEGRHNKNGTTFIKLDLQSLDTHCTTHNEWETAAHE